MNASSGQAIMSLNERSFTRAINRGEVLVDFTEPWCAPCQIQLPVLARVAEKCDHQVMLATVNVDEAPQLAAHFKIEAIPTLILFKNGRVTRRFVGMHPESTLVAALEDALAARKRPNNGC
jgi:thioredoxin 1